MNTKKISKYNGFSILLITFVWIFETSAVSPILDSLGKDFPGVSNFQLQLVSIMPFVTSIIFSIVAGYLSKYFNKKKIIIVGLIIYGITGMIPAFATSINQILLLRLLTGIGVGFTLPLPNAIISEYYEGEERKRMLGLGTSVANVANVINSVLIGFLLEIGWRYCFGAFVIILIIALNSIIGMPDSLPTKQTNQNKSKVSISSLPKIIFVLAFFMVLNWAVFQFNILNMAFFIMSEKLGAPWMIGLAIAVPGGFSIFSGIFFPIIYNKTKNYIIFLSLLIFTVGFFVLYSTHSFSVLVLANALIGFGSGLIVPFILYVTSKSVSTEQIDISFGIVSGCIHLGILASPFLQAGIAMLCRTDSIRFLYLFSAIGLAIFTVIALIYGVKVKCIEESVELPE